MSFSTILGALDNSAGIFLLIAFGFIVWKVSAWKANIEDRLSGVENRLSDVENRLSDVEKSIADLSKKVEEVYRAIIGRFGYPVEQTGSPVTLTEYGAELSDKIDADKIVGVYADKLYQETENMNAYRAGEFNPEVQQEGLCPIVPGWVFSS